MTTPTPATVGYRYDLDGNRRKLIYPDNTAVSYVFDAASRMQSVTDWASRTTSYSYFADGLVQTQTNFNGTSTTFSYDNARRLTQVFNQKGASTISQHTYTLDSVGNRTQLAEQLAQVGGGTVLPTTTYSYDHLYRLLGDGTTSYTYHPDGNRLTAGSQSLSYDRADRLASGTGCSVDKNGNVTLLGCVGGGQAAYDAANRLTSTRATGQPNVSYTYDGDGKRVRKNVQGLSTYIVASVYDVSGGLPVLLQDQITGAGAPPGHKYVWGAAGMAYSVDTNNIVLVAHTDGLGSVRALTDATGTLAQTYRTDAFGVPTQTQGSSSQPFQFTGEIGDENGLVDLRARMYDPQLGRFLQRDPVSGGTTSPSTLNRYSYVSGDPTTLTDRSGLCSDPGGPNIRYCIEAFIPGSGIGPFQGDNRGPNATSGNYRMRIDIKQTDTGTTVANVTPGVSRLQIEPDIARTADVIGCGAAQASNTGKNRLFLATCSASDGLLFHLSPPLMFSLTILESQSGSFSIGSAFGTLFPSLEIWQYGNGSPNGYWYNSGPASSKIGVDNAITELLAIDTVGYLRFQPATP